MSQPRAGSSDRIPAVSPEEYLRGDAELLNAGHVAVRVALFSGSAVSLGVSQPDTAQCAERARAVGLPVVRRSTGGLGLWHAPQDLAWSIVLPRSDPRVGRDFTKAYGRLGAGVVRFLAEYGVKGSWAPPVTAPGEYCLLSGAGDVLRIGERAVGGASQHLTASALLHHGVLPYSVDAPRLTALFDLPPNLIGSKLIGLSEALSGRPPLELADTLRQALSEELGLDA